MVMYSILRRASSSVLPLAIRAVGSPRAYRSVVSGAFTAENGKLAHSLSRRSFVPTLRFSTASADESLVQVLESEIDCAENSPENSPDISPIKLPEAFPFKIEDRPGERTILLTRSYEEEIIKVEIEIPQIETEEDEGEDEDEDEGEVTFERIPLLQPDVSEDQLAYDGPEFSDLDENLQRAFHKFLEIRGINTTTAEFLTQYMRYKDDKEYLLWLKNIKNFVAK